MHTDQQVIDLATAIHTRIGVKRHDTARTEPRPRVRPAAEGATGYDLTVGGAAGQAIKAGLVDELQLFQVPFVVGGASKRSPTVSVRDLEVLDTQRFAGCAVYLRYRPQVSVISSRVPQPIGMPGLATQPWPNLASRTFMPFGGCPHSSPRSVSPVTTPPDPYWPPRSARRAGVGAVGW
jgi:hypothetical protein